MNFKRILFAQTAMIYVPWKEAEAEREAEGEGDACRWFFKLDYAI